MLTALILIVVVAGIIVLARRWPDVEAKLWPDEVDVPEREARSGLPVDEVTTESAEPVAEEKTANGLMSKKAISAEPDVDEPVTVTTSAIGSDDPDQPASDNADAAAEPASFMDALPDVEEAESATETPAPASAAPAANPARAIPQPRVMGEPARPSQPAYVDATKRMAESFEQLAAEADRSWQERKYDKAEQACLKILVQQPKNHKYMTRIGQIYQETGDLEDAKEAFESAKKLDPKNFFVLNRLSEVERMITDKGGRTAAKKPVAQ